MVKRPGGAMIQSTGDSSLTRSILIPIAGKWRQIVRPAMIWPMVVSVGAWIALAAYPKTLNTPIEMLKNGIGPWNIPTYISRFMLVLALYLIAAIFYGIYLLCRRRKSVLLFVGMALFTAGVLISPLFHYYSAVFGGADPDTSSWLSAFIGIGLKEELVKATPVLFLLWLTRYLKSPWRERVGISDPLDGILLAAASAIGFSIMETLVQYISWKTIILPTGASMFYELNKTQLGPLTQELINRILRSPDLPSFVVERARLDPTAFWQSAQDFAQGIKPLQSLVTRVLSEGFGHLAYSGYFGYFIGWAALRPKRIWQFLAMGWASSALLHTFWDMNTDSWQPMFIIGVISYLVLMAAILKARDLSISPLYTGSSVLVGSSQPQKGFATTTPQVQTPQMPGAAGGTGAAFQQQPQVANEPQIQHGAGPGAVVSPALAREPLWRLYIDWSLGLDFGSSSAPTSIELGLGTKLVEADLPPLRAQLNDGIVAEVRSNPNNASEVGLTNRSSSVWHTTSPRGNTRDVLAGQSVVLNDGTSIDFGLRNGATAVVSKVPMAGAEELRVGSQKYPLGSDVKFMESHIPGLKALFADGVVAKVTRNRESLELELKNVSGSVWRLVTPGQQPKEFSSGESVALIRGAKIDFGVVEGELI